MLSVVPVAAPKDTLALGRTAPVYSSITSTLARFSPSALRSTTDAVTMSNGTTISALYHQLIASHGLDRGGRTPRAPPGVRTVSRLANGRWDAGVRDKTVSFAAWGSADITGCPSSYRENSGGRIVQRGSQAWP